MRSRDLVAMFVLLGAFVWHPSASGQNFSESEKKVWDKMQDALSLNATDDLARIAKANKIEVNGIFDKLEGELSFSDEVDKWNQVTLVQKAIDQALNNNLLEIHLAMLKKLTLDQRQQRRAALTQYYPAHDQIEAAITAKDEGQLQAAEKQLTELAQRFFDFGDLEYRAYALADAAKGIDASGAPKDALKMYQDIDDSLAAAGYKNWQFVGQVKESISRLKDVTSDPNAKAEPTKAVGNNTGTSWSPDPEGQRWSDPTQFRLMVEEKLVSKFTTPSPTSSENTQAWQDWVLKGNGPSEFESHFQPLGKKLKVSRDGIKIFIDDGDGKKREAKCISKPNVFEFSAEQKNSDGATVKGKYAVLLACGGDGEAFFGIQVNASPQPTQFAVRYQPACYLKGKVFDEDLLIFDDNASGRFGDSFEINDPTTPDKSEFTYDDAMLIGKDKAASPWTEYIEHGGAFYRLKLDTVDLTVKTRKLAVEVGSVKLAWKGPVKPEVVSIEERGEFKGAFFSIGDKPVKVPVGTYRLSYGIIRQGKGAQEKFCLILPGEATSFEVKPGEEHTLELGAPFTYRFTTEPQSKGMKVIGKSVQVFGKSNELYCHFRDEPPIPEEVSMRVKGGAPTGKPQAMQRATFQDYQKDGLAVWGPLDLTINGAPGQTYEVKMELKKHKLLGGPIKSEWK